MIREIRDVRDSGEERIEIFYPEISRRARSKARRPNRGRKIVVEFFLAVASPRYIETGELRGEERHGSICTCSVNLLNKQDRAFN